MCFSFAEKISQADVLVKACLAPSTLIPLNKAL